MNFPLHILLWLVLNWQGISSFSKFPSPKMLISHNGVEISVSIKLFFFFFIKLIPEPSRRLHVIEWTPAQENRQVSWRLEGSAAYRFHQALHRGGLQHQSIEHVVRLLPHIQQHWKRSRREAWLRRPHSRHRCQAASCHTRVRGWQHLQGRGQQMTQTTPTGVTAAPPQSTSSQGPGGPSREWTDKRVTLNGLWCFPTLFTLEFLKVGPLSP